MVYRDDDSDAHSVILQQDDSLLVYIDDHFREKFGETVGSLVMEFVLWDICRSGKYTRNLSAKINQTVGLCGMLYVGASRTCWR
jgi:hypothetical protein